MDEELCSHVSMHVLRFDEERTSADIGALPVPPDTAFWTAMVDVALGENIVADRVGPEWGVVGLHTSGGAADRVVADPAAALPFLGDAAESWHASFDVVAHRGAVDWLRPDEPGLALAPADEDPGGVLAVMTTAGFVLDADFDPARAQEFTYNVDQVRPMLASAAGNVFSIVFAGRELDAPDPITFTVWTDDSAMRDAAYRSGMHRDVIDWYKRTNSADRTSFTRLRPRATGGTWRGVDPVAVARAAAAAAT